jgi:hypothetical protein
MHGFLELIRIYRISFLSWVLSKRKSNTLKPSCSSAIRMSDIIQKLGITSISTYPVITKVWVSADIHGCYLSGFICIIASMQCLPVSKEYSWPFPWSEQVQGLDDDDT